MTRIARLMVAISEDLRQKLEVAAAKGKRSLSAEMLLRLENSFTEDDEAAETRALVQSHESRISALEDEIDRILHSTGIEDRYNRHD